MIRIISGIIGAGKTLLANYFMYLDTCLNGYDNYIKSCKKIEEYNSAGFNYKYPVQKHTTYFNGNVHFRPMGKVAKDVYIFNPWRLALPSLERDTHLFLPYGKIYIDEAQTYYNSRLSMYFPAAVSRFFELSRQFDLEITLIAQRAGLIDLNIREIAEELLYIKKLDKEEDCLGNLVKATWTIQKFTNNADLEHYLDGKRELGEEITIECTENLYKFYDTKFYRFLFLNQRKSQEFLQQTLAPFKYSPEICNYLSEIFKAQAPEGYYKKTTETGR